MTKNSSIAIQAVIVAVVFLLVFVLSYNAYADVVTPRDRGSSGRITTPPPPPPSPVPPPVPPISNPSGGITNVTNGEVNSGGNSGGNVTTGDEHIEVIVVNIGPTNNTPPSVTPSPAPPPSPTCDPRTRGGCDTQGGGRTR